MKYVFNKDIGKGFLKISANDLMVHVHDPRFVGDDMDSIRQFRYAQQYLHEKGINAIMCYIDGKGKEPGYNEEPVSNDLRKIRESLLEFMQFHSGDRSDIKFIYCGLLTVPKVSGW